jgi:hypothetical protein
MASIDSPLHILTTNPLIVIPALCSLSTYNTFFPQT